MSNTLSNLGNAYFSSNVVINSNLITNQTVFMSNTLSNLGNAYFASNVIVMSNTGIGTITPQGRLDVRGTAYMGSNIGTQVAIQDKEVKFQGTGTVHYSVFNSNSLLSFNNTSANATPGIYGSPMMVLNSTGYLGINTTTPTGFFEVVDTTNNIFYLTEYNDTDGAVIRTKRARGTIAAPTALQTGDCITGLRGSGHNSSTFSSRIGGVNIFASSNYSVGNTGTYINFETTASNSSSFSEKMRITDAGNVGINTTTPAYTLDVNGIAYIRSNLYVGTSNVAQNSIFFGGQLGDFDSLGKPYSAIISRNYDPAGNTAVTSDNSEILIIQMNDPGPTSGPDRIRHVAAAHKFQVYNAAITPADTNTFYADNNYTIAMYINPTGQVGIGTSNQNAPLQLANTLANRKLVLYDTFNNDHQYYGFGIQSGTLRYQVDATTSAHIFYAATSASASSELMRLTGTGNLGIGTNSPSSTLHIESPNTGSTPIASFFNSTLTNNNTCIAIGKSTAAGCAFINYSTVTSSTQWGIFNGNTITLNSTGLGIGTASPVYALDVTGQVRYTYSSSQGLIMKNTSATPTNEIYFDSTASTSGTTAQKAAIGMGDSSRNFYIWVNTQDRLVIDTSGNVGIGAAPNSSYKLYVNGALSNTTINTGAITCTTINTQNNNISAGSGTITAAYVTSTGGIASSYGSIGNYPSISGGAGFQTGWNRNSGGGRTDFCGYGQAGAGGFDFWYANASSTTPTLMSIMVPGSFENRGNIYIQNPSTTAVATQFLQISGDYLGDGSPNSMQIGMAGSWATQYGFINMLKAGVASQTGLYFQMSGTNVMYLNPSGNLGIGTNNPVYKLDVAGTGHFTDKVWIGTTSGNETLNVNGSLGVTGTTITNASGSGIINTTTINCTTVNATTFSGTATYATSAGGCSGGAYFYISGADASQQGIHFGATAMRWIYYTDSSTSMKWYNTGGDRMTLTSGGNLSVTGSVTATSFTGDISKNNLAITNTYGQMEIKSEYHIAYRADYDGNNGGADHIFYATTNERMRLTSGGNLGIGTDGPRQALDVTGSIVTDWVDSRIIAMQYSDGTQYKMGMQMTGSSRYLNIINQSGDNIGVIAFSTGSAPTERMRIAANGNVGIGTASPGYKLDVAGDINFTGNLRQNGSVYGDGSSTNYDTNWRAYGSFNWPGTSSTNKKIISLYVNEYGILRIWIPRPNGDWYHWSEHILNTTNGMYILGGDVSNFHSPYSVKNTQASGELWLPLGTGEVFTVFWRYESISHVGFFYPSDVGGTTY